MVLLPLNPLFAFDSTDVEEIIAENTPSEIQHKLERATIINKFGIPLAICGTISAPVGLIMMATADIQYWSYTFDDGLYIDSDGPQAYIGLALIIAGIFEMGGGALCIFVAPKQAANYRAALEKLNVMYDSKSKSCGIQYSVAF